MYDHYISLDWAQSNMAIAKMTRGSSKAKTMDVRSNIKELQFYLKNLRGKKILTFEETTTSQWLYTELRECVDEILICDPYRNRLLSEGPKTDRLDAVKLVELLKAGLLKPVFHSGDEFIYLRKFVSGYEDTVKAGVRLKNQRAALFRANGKNKKDKTLDHSMEKFVLEGIDRSIESYKSHKERYEGQMARLSRKYSMIRNLDSIFGIGKIGAVKIAARVVNPRRFKNKGKWLGYCGLIKLERTSGGKSYGKKNPRYCRMMKSVFKTAAISAIGENTNNPFKDYYEYLMREKGRAEHNARHATARKIAVAAWGVMKSGKRFEAIRRLETIKK